MSAPTLVADIDARCRAPSGALRAGRGGPMTSVSIEVATITIRTDSPVAVARFWRDLLDYEVAPNHSSSVLLTGAGPALLVQPSEMQPSQMQPSGSAVHLDLRPDDAPAAVARALALGATRADVGQRGDEGWTVLADPGGNVFCILEGTAEHAQRRQLDPGERTNLD